VCMPPNMPIHRLKVAVLPLDLTYSGLVTHSVEILTTGLFHKKNPVIFTQVQHKKKPTTCRKNSFNLNSKLLHNQHLHVHSHVAFVFILPL